MNTVVDLLRHGEPLGGNAYRGSGVDDPLSETGWVQMRGAVGECRDWDVIVSSPLQRCRQFSEELGSSRGIPILVEGDLREVGFGAWEGKTREQLIAADPEGYDAFYRDPLRCRPAGAESLDDFVSRVSQAYDRLVTRHSGGRLLLVSHAGVIRAIVAFILGAPPVAMYRIRIDHAGLSRVRHGTHGAQVEFHNAKRLP